MKLETFIHLINIANNNYAKQMISYNYTVIRTGILQIIHNYNSNVEDFTLNI